MDNQKENRKINRQCSLTETQNRKFFGFLELKILLFWSNEKKNKENTALFFFFDWISSQCYKDGDETPSKDYTRRRKSKFKYQNNFEQTTADKNKNNKGQVQEQITGIDKLLSKMDITSRHHRRQQATGLAPHMFTARCIRPQSSGEEQATGNSNCQEPELP